MSKKVYYKVHVANKCEGEWFHCTEINNQEQLESNIKYAEQHPEEFKVVEYEDAPKSHCQHCHKEEYREELDWVSDRYGIPYKYVCDDCREEVLRQIGAWEFDEADAGEELEPEYY